MIAKRSKLVEQVKTQTPIHPLYLAHCLNELKAKDAIIVNELGLPVGGLEMTAPRSYLGLEPCRRPRLRARRRSWAQSLPRPSAR